MNRIQKFIITGMLCAASCVGCQEKNTPEKPEGGELLSRPVMIELLIETHLAESAAAWKGRKLVDEELLYAHYEKLLMARYRTDTATYLRSLRYYLNRPAIAAELYSAVLDSIERRKERLYPTVAPDKTGASEVGKIK